jgi:glycosyltransferase involved in cell wall biosynthesis
MPRFVEIFPLWRNAHFSKDIGMLPRQLQKNGFSCEVWTKDNEKTKETYGLKLQILSTPFFFAARKKLKAEAKDIDALCVLHSHPLNPFYIRTYKRHNPKGIAYMKADMDETVLNIDKPTPFNLLRQLKISMNFAKADVITIEQRRVLEFMQSRYPEHAKKMRLLPSGYGDETPIKSKTFQQKENLILVVGVVGSRQKATDTTLKVIASSKSIFTEWKVLFVGQIVQEFLPEIEAFFKQHPELKGKVIFNGPTTSRKQMLELYNNAKILLMPTRWEGFSNVPAEAAHFGNVIIGTKVGGVWELTDEGRIGKICDIDNVSQIAKALQKFTANQKVLEQHSKRSREFCDRHHSWKTIAAPFARDLKKLIAAAK